MTNYNVFVFKKIDNQIYQIDMNDSEILFFKYEKENDEGYNEYNLKHIFNYYVYKNKETNKYEFALKIHGQIECFYKKELFNYHVVKCGKNLYLNEDLFNNDFNNDFENELFNALIDGYYNICGNTD